MKNQTSPEINQCPFCEVQLAKELDRCNQCGGEKIQGHINRSERKLIVILRFAFCAIALIYFNFLYSLSGGFVLKLFLLLVALSVALAIPRMIFKVKNKSNVVWKKKNLPI